MPLTMAAPPTSSPPSQPFRITPSARAAWLLLFACVLFLLNGVLLQHAGHLTVLHVLPLLALGLAAVSLLSALAQIRGRPELTDALLPLILLNPLLIVPAQPLDKPLLGAALLAMLAAVIVGMRRESLRRYLLAAGIMAALPVVSLAFLLLLPAMILWLGFVGFLLSRDHDRAVRPKGFVVMALGEIGLVLFGVACLLAPTEPLPGERDLFATIVSFADFPLTVAGIVGIALAWGRHPRGGNPPWMTGLFALLLGFLTLLLNNFQSGRLPPPGADQTMVLLCVVYVVFGLGSPRSLRWAIAFLLLAAAIAYTVFRPYGKL